MNYSVLMPVYDKEKPDHLKRCMQSMLDQSAYTNDFVLVCNGPLTAELDAVVVKFLEKTPVLHIVQLDKNYGIGIALNMGIKYCINEWIVRMDSDDIAYPYRCERQLAFVAQHRLDVASATVVEFEENLCCRTRNRELPVTHAEIVQFARRRNPMNHPCTLYRKSKVLEAGGYRDMPGFEDYDLWVRMLQCGARMGNMKEPLLYMRAGEDMLGRRGGYRYCKNIIRFWCEMKRLGFVTYGECICNIILRCIVSLLPNSMRKHIYLKRLRDNVGK